MLQLRDYIHSLKKKFKKYLNHYQILKKYHGFKKSLKTKVHGYSFILILEHLLLIDMTLAIMVEYKGQHLLKVMEKFINLFKTELLKVALIIN